MGQGGGNGGGGAGGRLAVYAQNASGWSGEFTADAGSQESASANGIENRLQPASGTIFLSFDNGSDYLRVDCRSSDASR